MNKGLKLSAIPLFLSACGGRTTTCIVITPPGISPTGTWDSASVRLFSNILPALISFKSLTVFGAISLSVSKNENNKFHSASKNDRHGLQNREFAREKFQCVGQYDNTVSFQHNQPRGLRDRKYNMLLHNSQFEFWNANWETDEASRIDAGTLQIDDRRNISCPWRFAYLCSDQHMHACASTCCLCCECRQKHQYSFHFPHVDSARKAQFLLDLVQFSCGSTSFKFSWSQAKGSSFTKWENQRTVITNIPSIRYQKICFLPTKSLIFFIQYR